MKYLFIDIECANLFDDICKICSFGYVIIDDLFNVIEKKDIVINPEDKFDSYFSKLDSKITMAYPESMYFSQQPFHFHYDEINRVLNAQYEGIFGWDIGKDFKYIRDSTNRYNLPEFNHISDDVRDILKMHNILNGKLHEVAQSFVPDYHLYVDHKSDDDAHLVAKILQYVCKQLNVSIKELLQRQ